MSRQHAYTVKILWESENGTTAYKDYLRDHIVAVDGKPAIAASADPAFSGNPGKYNPEELFVAAISNCHMLWYLHLCAVNGIVVLKYEDAARGTMLEQADGSGKFTEVILYPTVTVSSADMITKAHNLHTEAHKFCFIANSLNFAVTHEPRIIAL